MVEQLKKSNPAFMKLVKECERSKEFRGLSLEDMRVKPVQRLPKYVLLFQDLVKHTMPSHPDYLDLVKVLQLF
jgi:hypothetical protein